MTRAGPPAPLVDLVRRHHLPATATGALAVIHDRLSNDPRAPISSRERERVLDRHIADSLVALELGPVREALRIADLGSGAGLPGVVLAVARPDAQVWTVESRGGKCAWITSLVTAAALDNVQVVCARAEEWAAGIGVHDLVVARALAAQPVVLEYAAPLLAAGGHLVEWRGRRDPADEARGEAAAADLGLRLVEVRQVKPFPDAEARHLHVFAKVAETPSRFPRRSGLAAKRPLGTGSAVPGRR